VVEEGISDLCRRTQIHSRFIVDRERERAVFSCYVVEKGNLDFLHFIPCQFVGDVDVWLPQSFRVHIASDNCIDCRYGWAFAGEVREDLSTTTEGGRSGR